jgi:hypothetical protein
VKEEEFMKGLRDSQRLRESLNPTVKGIPTERPEITTSCGLNPIVKGIPTERLETTISCGLVSTMLINDKYDQSNVYVLVKEFFYKDS